MVVLSNFYPAILVVHILSVIGAVGAVFVIDYFHLISFRKKKLESKIAPLYPALSKLINISLTLLILSGIFLVLTNPALLQSSLFKTKMALVLVVAINGIYLQKKVSPNLEACMKKGTKACPIKVLYMSAISGSISAVTWIAIVVLSITKEQGYSASTFLTYYSIILILATIIAFLFERKSRKWREN